MPAKLENSAVAIRLEKFSFHSSPKERQCQRLLNLPHIFPRASHMLAKKCSRFSKPVFNSTWTVNFLMSKLDSEKPEESEIKLQTSTGSWKKQESSRKNIYLCFIDYAKAFDCVDHKKLWKILKEMRIPDFLTCFLRNLYAGQEVTVRTGLGKTNLGLLWWTSG